MMAPMPPQSEDRLDGVPERLGADLRRAFGPVPSLPAGFDERVLRAAHDRLSMGRVRRGAGLRYCAGGAIAAMVALSAAVWFMPAPAGPSPIAQAGPGDVNHDGRVDVLDAMALALAVERGAGGVDLNHDALIDDADVALLTAQIVALSPTEGDQG